MSGSFSLTVPVAKIGRDGLSVSVTADTDDRALLAERMGIPAVREMTCAFTLTPSATNPAHIEAAGLLEARVVRECVVSAEEFDTEVREQFSVRFVPEGEESEELDPGEDDEIPYRAGVIDLAEAAAEQLALVLDPYPRIDGAMMPEFEDGEDRNPFGVLARLRDENKTPD